MNFRYLALLAILLSGSFITSRTKYHIAVKKNSQDLASLLDDLSNYSPLYPPSSKYYADPMLYKHEGVNYIFFEDYDYAKGRIAYVTVDEDLNFSPSKIVLDLPYHLSFPCIFQDDGNIYMIPESAKASEVALFEAVHFPNTWKKISTLVKKGLGDPSLFKYGEYYWLFASQGKDLYIYYSKNLRSKFKAHPINKKNLHGRNAGKIFLYEGALIRPVMNPDVGYGRSMILREIVELNTKNFVEQDITHIEPTWAPGLDGTHTFNMNEDLIVYDGRQRKSKDQQH